MRYDEDTLVQATTADYLRDQLGWESVYAYNTETFGKEGTLGRKDDTEVVLTRYLGEALVKLNPGLPQEAYQAAIREITQATVSQLPLQANREKYNLVRDGVLVTYRDEKGTLKRGRLRVFDFENPEENHFLCVRELWIKGSLYRRRADIVGFVNGLPLLFMELKNVHRDLRRAFDENLADYKDTIPHVFQHNGMIVLGNGTTAKLGSLSSKFKHFREWKRLAEEEPGAVDMETLLKGVCSKANFLDLFENFILFDDSGEAWQKFVPGTYYGQYFRLRVVVENGNPAQVTGVITGFSYTVSAPPRVDHYQNLSIAAGGTAVTFRPDNAASPAPFNGGPNGSTVPYVNASWQNQPGDQLVISGLTRAGMTVLILNGGVGVARSGFNVNVEGY
jgi:type I site-specific restriction-modification system R (restriction) subunit